VLIRFVRFAGLIGIVAPIFALSAVFVSTVLCGAGCGEAAKTWSHWQSGYSFSWSINALSDLGVSSVAGIFNYALVAAGLLNAIFALGFMKAYGKASLFYLGAAILILGGGSLSLVGVFTEAYGPLHGYVSLGYFVLFPVGMILVGLAFRGMGERSKSYPSITLGIAALIVILSGAFAKWHLWLGLGFAVPEIIEALIIGGWVAFMGASLLRAESPGRV